MGNAADFITFSRDDFGYIARRLLVIRAFVRALSQRTGALLRGGGATAIEVPRKNGGTSETVFAVGTIQDSLAQARGLRQFTSRQLGNRHEAWSFLGAGETQAGFVLIQSLTLIPLVMTAIGLAAGAQFVFKRKLKAQSLCVLQATKLQMDLKKTLTQLLGMNPQALRLRIARQKADETLAKAVSSGFPPAIAAAQAAQLAVILAQTAFHAKQLSLLAGAKVQRMDHHRELSMNTRSLIAGVVSSKSFYVRPLAVEPGPAFSLSPDYKTVADFRRLQQHRFSYHSILTPSFLKTKSEFNFRQITECSVTLEEKGNSWQPKILAASAPLKRL